MPASISQGTGHWHDHADCDDILRAGALPAKQGQRDRLAQKGKAPAAHEVPISRNLGGIRRH
jgi:hypothetical protein